METLLWPVHLKKFNKDWTKSSQTQVLSYWTFVEWFTPCSLNARNMVFNGYRELTTLLGVQPAAPCAEETTVQRLQKSTDYKSQVICHSSEPSSPKTLHLKTSSP